MRWGRGSDEIMDTRKRSFIEWTPTFFLIPHRTLDAGWVWLENGYRRRVNGWVEDWWQYLYDHDYNKEDSSSG
jgi:hypothetical protein